MVAAGSPWSKVRLFTAGILAEMDERACDMRNHFEVSDRHGDFFRECSDTNPKSIAERGLVTSGFGTITWFRQAPDEVVHLSQYLGLVRLENIMTRIF